MHRFGTSVILSACTIALLFFGCTGDGPVAPDFSAVDDPVDVFLINSGSASPDDQRLFKFFTGRDSFGVALKANVHVDASGHGSGTATHMGAISIRQDLDPDLTGLMLNEARFRFEGSTGASLEGRYEAELERTGVDDAYTIHGTMWVDGGTIKATDLPAEGMGTIEGTLYPDGSFNYRLDGWLLHHVVEPSE